MDFSLLAIRDDPLPALQLRLQQAQGSGNSAEAAEIMSTISNENSKRERWAVGILISASSLWLIHFTTFFQFENSLRRHNHVGLVHALLVALAKGGKLSQAQEQAKKTMQERIEKRKAKGEDMDED